MRPQRSALLLLLILAACGSNSLSTRYSSDWAIVVSERLTTSHVEELAKRHGLRNRGQIGNLRNHYWLHLPDGNGSILDEKTVALQSEKHVVQVYQQKLQVRVRKGYESSDACLWSSQWSLKNTGQTNGPSDLDLNVEPVWIQGVTGEGVVVGVVDDGVDYTHPAIEPNYYPSASYDFIHDNSDPTPDPPLSSDDEPNSHGTGCAGEIAMTRDSKCGSGVAFKSKFAALKINLVSDSTDAAEASALSHQSDVIQVYSNSWGPADDGFEVDGPEGLVNETLVTAVTEGRDGNGSIYVWAAGNGGSYYDSCAADGYASSIYTIAVGSADQDGQQAYYDENCAGKMAVTFSYNSATFPSADDNWDAYDQVVTTDLNSKCTDGFTGTSASAPLLTGVIALALEVNPGLSWRDVQYLIAYTSSTRKLVGGNWTLNKAGLNVSHEFGFGAIDAEALVTRARHWTTVPPQLIRQTVGELLGTVQPGQPWSTTLSVNTDIAFVEHVILRMSLDVKGYDVAYGISDFYQALYHYYDYDETSKGNIRFADFDFDDYGDAKSVNGRTIYDWLADPHPKRGDIQVELTSPQGTTSIMLPYRKYDFINDEGYSSWPFMSVHFWGENPSGTWTVKVMFKSSSAFVKAVVESLTLYGTSSVPAAVSNIPSQCDPSCVSGCAGTGSDMCDACISVRNASTLQCATSCGNGNEEYDGYCVTSYSSSSPSISCYTSIIIPIAVMVGVILLILGIVLVFCISCYCFRRYKSMNRSHRFVANVDEEASSFVDEDL